MMRSVARTIEMQGERKRAEHGEPTSPAARVEMILSTHAEHRLFCKDSVRRAYGLAVDQKFLRTCWSYVMKIMLGHPFEAGIAAPATAGPSESLRRPVLPADYQCAPAWPRRGRNPGGAIHRPPSVRLAVGCRLQAVLRRPVESRAVRPLASGPATPRMFVSRRIVKGVLGSPNTRTRTVAWDMAMTLGLETWDPLQRLAADEDEHQGALEKAAVGREFD